CSFCYEIIKPDLDQASASQALIETKQLQLKKSAVLLIVQPLAFAIRVPRSLLIPGSGSVSEVNNVRRGLVKDLESKILKPFAQIHILFVKKEVFVKSAHSSKEFSPDHQRASAHVIRIKAIGRFFLQPVLYGL